MLVILDLIFDRMEFGDFLQRYDSLEICNLTPDAPVEMPKQWYTAEFHQRWVRGFSAGGRPSNSGKYFGGHIICSC